MQVWFLIGVYVKTIVDYGIDRKYFIEDTDARSQNPAEKNNKAPFDFHYVIAEEISVLSTEISNDTGEAGGLIQNLHHPDLDPVRIVREEIDKTALRRIILPAFDRENPLPETLAGILPMSFPPIFYPVMAA